MDKRNWPWKKKSSQKASSTKDAVGTSVICSQGNQISAQAFTHMENQVKTLTEKLSSSQSDMTNKDNLVKQHAKVAEEAVSGWEKAEAETLDLKQHLESVTMLQLTAEDRASHLDGALKECMKQMRNLQEDNEKKLQDTVFTKNMQCDKIRSEMEAKVMDLEQELLRSSAEISALSKSLQDRSSLLRNISEEKSQADAEIEALKNDIQSCEREINSLKYEFHIVSKENEIRTEEKNMSVRSAEAANKQHIEDVKKMTKLEAECQRLRGLVRKKLPGPAALAQMKIEVENLGRDYGEPRSRRSSTKNLSRRLGFSPDFPIENTQNFHNDSESLPAHLLAMDEESVMLKEALLKRDSELQTSRRTCAHMASKLRSMETHMLILNQHKSPSKTNMHPFEKLRSRNESNPSLASMSEDGGDEEGSCSGSWATTPASEFSPFKKENGNSFRRSNNSTSLEFMDDFLEMEQLALSAETNGITVSDGATDNMKLEMSDATSVVNARTDGDDVQHADLGKPVNEVSSIEQPSGKLTLDRHNVILSKLQLRIMAISESQGLDTDRVEIPVDVAQNMADMQESSSCPSKEQRNEVKVAISLIHDFIVSLYKEAMEIHGRSSHVLGLKKNIEEFSGLVDKVLGSEINVSEYVCALSYFLSETRGLTLNMFTAKANEKQMNNIDCIDKVTLLENKISQEPIKERTSGDCVLVSPSATSPEFFKCPTSPGIESKSMLPKSSLDDHEEMKLHKVNMQIDLDRCIEALGCTKLQLKKSEQDLTDLNAQLVACQNSNSLADTQLKCMTESYKMLESHKRELEAEVKQLHTKLEALEQELQEERRSHQDDLARYNDLQAIVERNMRCNLYSIHSEADDIKKKQERELAATAEKLAECQESILLLDRQLKALHPSAELGSYQNGIHQISDILEDDPTPNVYNSQPGATENPTHYGLPEQQDVDVSLPAVPKRPRQRSRSASSSSLSSILSEKQPRRLSRFFFKGRSDQ